MLSKYVIFSAVVLAVPSFARSVGEMEESENNPESFFDFGNLETLNSALRETREFQLDRRIAALAPISAPATAASVTQNRPAPGESSRTTDAIDTTDAAVRTDEQASPVGEASVSRSSAFPGYGSAGFPLDVDKIRDLVEPVRAVPGVSVANPLEGYLTGLSPSANRAPAVLPQADPGLAPFAEPPTSTFGDRDEKTFATLGNPGNRGEKSDDQSKKQDEIDQAQERKDREAFEESLSDLAGRQKPYTFKDYVDYRDFVAEQGGPLGELDLSASDFRQKAEELFNGFEKRDVSGETASRKAIFRDFVKTREDDAQRLIAEPSAHDRGKSAAPKTNH